MKRQNILEKSDEAATDDVEKWPGYLELLGNNYFAPNRCIFSAG
jgi:hypothetical protein